MPAHVIALVNMKGGVGKTTLTVALAEGLSVMAKKRVLMMDLDAQASGTLALGGKKTFKTMIGRRRHTYQLFQGLFKQLGIKTMVPLANDPLEIGELPVAPRGKAPALHARKMVQENASLITPTPPLDLMGAVPELQILERQIIYRLGQLTQEQGQAEDVIARYFQERIAELADAYDYIVIDCPPGISAFTEAAVRSADTVLMPVVPEYLSQLGLEAFGARVLRRLKNTRAWRGQALVVVNRVIQSDIHDRFRKDIRKTARTFDDVMRVFPQEIENAPEFVAALESEYERSIRDRYGRVIPTVEDLVRNVLDMTETVHA